MVIFPLAPDQTIAQMWSNGARGGSHLSYRHGQTDIRICIGFQDSISRLTKKFILTSLTQHEPIDVRDLVRPE